jgi:hypothetical protein
LKLLLEIRFENKTNENIQSNTERQNEDFELQQGTATDPNGVQAPIAQTITGNGFEVFIDSSQVKSSRPDTIYIQINFVLNPPRRLSGLSMTIFPTLEVSILKTGFSLGVLRFDKNGIQFLFLGGFSVMIFKENFVINEKVKVLQVVKLNLDTFEHEVNVS